MKDAYQISCLKQKYKNEQVLVTPSIIVSNVPDGFCYGVSKAVDGIFKAAHTFIYRYDAEYNDSFVQLIPYVVVTNEKQNSLFITQRIAGEERLALQFSLGCGGHVNPNDLSEDTLYTAAVREMNEELDISLIEDTDVMAYGTVRDLASSTKEHLGLVYLATAAKVKIKEKDTLRGRWMNMSDLVINYYSFESWGRHIIDHLFLNYKKSGRLFKITPLMGAKKYDQKRKETVW